MTPTATKSAGHCTRAATSATQGLRASGRSVSSKGGTGGRPRGTGWGSGHRATGDGADALPRRRFRRLPTRRLITLSPSHVACSGGDNAGDGPPTPIRLSPGSLRSPALVANALKQTRRRFRDGVDAGLPAGDGHARHSQLTSQGGLGQVEAVANAAHLGSRHPRTVSRRYTPWQAPPRRVGMERGTETSAMGDSWLQRGARRRRRTSAEQTRQLRALRVPEDVCRTLQQWAASSDTLDPLLRLI